MHPLSDNDLDRLSREAAEQFDVEQNSSGWEKLEHKLNSVMPIVGKKERWRFLFFIWLFALLSGGGLFWLLTGQNSSSRLRSAELNSNSTSKDLKTRESSNAPSNPGQPDPILLKKQTPGKGTVTTPVNPATEKIAQDDVNTITDEVNTITPPNVQKKNAGLKQKNTTPNRVSINRKRPVSLLEQNVPANFPMSSAAFPGVTNKVGSEMGHTTSDEGQTKNTEKSEPLLLSLNTQSMVFPGPENPTLLPTDFVIQSPPSQTAQTGTAAKKTNSSTSQAFRKGFELGAVIAPDMSNVRFSHSDKIGYNYGLQIGYRFTPRWSMNTGVLFTRKNYTSRGKDFNPPKGSWLDNVNLDMVEGDCLMFDIPVNIRYDLNQNNSQRVYVSTGLSSYLMKKEDYHYYYQYTNGSPGYRHRSSSSTERHWLGILNLSAGFEKSINKKFSVQAEPYLKIPLKGIGYGNIQLNSYGVYFSLKYKPGFFSK